LNIDILIIILIITIIINMNLSACQYSLLQLICSYHILTSFHQYAPRFSCILDTF